LKVREFFQELMTFAGSHEFNSLKYVPALASPNIRNRRHLQYFCIPSEILVITKEELSKSFLNVMIDEK